MQSSKVVRNAYAYFATILSKGGEGTFKALPVDYRQPRNHHHSGRSAANPEGTGSGISFTVSPAAWAMCGSCGMVIMGARGWPVDQRL